jgi:hypothetical protein
LKELFWGSQVPSNWRESYQEELLTIPELTDFTRTANHLESLEFISKLAWRTEYIHIERLFISDLRRVSPLIIISNPRVKTPEEAKKTGKPIVYLQGNIHPSEAEGKESLLMVIRDITVGKKSHYLDNMIILVAPDFNPDGTETWEIKNTSVFSGTPHLQSLRHNAIDTDVNRDGIKMETVNMQGLYKNVLNNWDPILTLDIHSMGRVQHGYCNLYAPSYTPTGNPGPREYTQYKVLPWVKERGEKKYGAMYFSHADFDWDTWPPKVWDPVKAGYSVEAKFIVNAVGLRNRMSILTETPGHVGFEKRIWACYTFILCLLDYIKENGKEMIKVCKQADDQVVNDVLEKGKTGTLKNWVQGEYAEQEKKINLYAYNGRQEEYIPGTSILQHFIGEGKPELITDIIDLTKPVGTKDAIIPRGYVFYEELSNVAEKLIDHGLKVNQTDESMTVDGYEFIIDNFKEVKKGWIRMYEMTELYGGWFKTRKTFPAGSYHVDMAQPLANVAFYCLEPEVGDGFAGWNFFNEYLVKRGAKTNSVVFPVFKYLDII